MFLVARIVVGAGVSVPLPPPALAGCPWPDRKVWQALASRRNSFGQVS
jgi:hypothetical protein